MGTSIETLLACSYPGSYMKISLFNTQARALGSCRTSKVLYFLTQWWSQTVFSGDRQRQSQSRRLKERPVETPMQRGGW